jgi:hypothetical protein
MRADPKSIGPDVLRETACHRVQYSAINWPRQSAEGPQLWFLLTRRPDDRLAITNLRAWRRKPASGRRYSLVKLHCRGGAAGYGEGGPFVAAEMTRLYCL